jgi:copper homeostasis protein
MSNLKKLEICVGSVHSALAAQKGGAHRIELCDNLLEGGTTPSAGMIKTVRSLLEIPVHVIIRPRGGDFFYSDQEYEIMQEDIRFCKSCDIDGVVIGLLNPDGSIDKERTRSLVELARPLSVTFHRAFDMTPDPYSALDTLIELGIDRILTSGQQNSALDAIDLIMELVTKAGERIMIMPGGGLSEKNIFDFARTVGAREYHATLRSLFPGGMVYRREGIYMGGHPDVPEFDQKETDPVKVAKFVDLLKSI